MSYASARDQLLLDFADCRALARDAFADDPYTLAVEMQRIAGIEKLALQSLAHRFGVLTPIGELS